MGTQIQSVTAIKIYTDGGSRGNPGPSATGTYIVNEHDYVLAQIGKRIGITTNNVAEYGAIVEGFNWLLDNTNNLKNLKSVDFFMDSNLAVSQLNGKFKIKNPNLINLFYEIKEKEKKINLEISYVHIPREQNKNADLLVNLALDGKI